MRWLLAFDRREAKLIERIDLTEAASNVVQAAHAQAEEKYMSRIGVVEVVVVEADSLETLRQTHARYFKNVGQLAQDFAQAENKDD